ncbi:MAG: hypothetical protein ACI8P3_001079 [Saprospiraceae bacterium]|jgi:hypothetical protein
MTKPIDIFIAYAVQDKDLMERLRKQLSVAERIGLVDAWHDGEIEVGTDREEASRKAMEEAEIIVLLISADFFASEYLYEKEMKQALQLSKTGKATVIPVLLKECTWQLTPVAKLQVLPKNTLPVTNEHWKHPDNAFNHVVDELIRISNQIREGKGIPTTAYTPKPSIEDPSIEKTIHKTAPDETAPDETPLWKLALYAFGALGAMALFSFLVNQIFTNPVPTEPVSQEENFDQPIETTIEKPIDPPIKQSSQQTDYSPPKEQAQTPREQKGSPPDIPKTTAQTTISEESQAIPPSFATIKIGKLEWAARNMNIGMDNSWCYKDDPSNCTKYGRLYNFEAAIKRCPKGWRLPIKEEWLSLSTDDISKLGLTKGGVYDRGTYRQGDQIGYYFTAVRSGGGEAWVIEFRGNEKPLQKDRRYTHWGMSCRCVR